MIALLATPSHCGLKFEDSILLLSQYYAAKAAAQKVPDPDAMPGAYPVSPHASPSLFEAVNTLSTSTLFGAVKPSPQLPAEGALRVGQVARDKSALAAFACLSKDWQDLAQNSIFFKEMWIRASVRDFGLLQMCRRVGAPVPTAPKAIYASMLQRFNGKKACVQTRGEKRTRSEFSDFPRLNFEKI